jgi:hypothetical protein
MTIMLFCQQRVNAGEKARDSAGFGTSTQQAGSVRQLHGVHHHIPADDAASS